MWGYLTLGTNYLWYGTLDGMGIFFLYRVDYSYAGSAIWILKTQYWNCVIFLFTLSYRCRVLLITLFITKKKKWYEFHIHSIAVLLSGVVFLFWTFFIFIQLICRIILIDMNITFHVFTISIISLFKEN